MKQLFVLMLNICVPVMCITNLVFEKLILLSMMKCNPLTVCGEYKKCVRRLSCYKLNIKYLTIVNNTYVCFYSSAVFSWHC